MRVAFRADTGKNEDIFFFFILQFFCSQIEFKETILPGTETENTKQIKQRRMHTNNVRNG